MTKRVAILELVNVEWADESRTPAVRCLDEHENYLHLAPLPEPWEIDEIREHLPDIRRMLEWHQDLRLESQNLTIRRTKKVFRPVDPDTGLHHPNPSPGFGDGGYVNPPLND